MEQEEEKSAVFWSIGKGMREKERNGERGNELGLYFSILFPLNSLNKIIIIIFTTALWTHSQSPGRQ